MQIFVPVGQVPPQLTPSHVAAPPVGTGQGLQLLRAMRDVGVRDALAAADMRASATQPARASTPAAPPAPVAPAGTGGTPEPGFPSGFACAGVHGAQSPCRCRRIRYRGRRHPAWGASDAAEDKPSPAAPAPARSTNSLEATPPVSSSSSPSRAGRFRASKRPRAKATHGRPRSSRVNEQTSARSEWRPPSSSCQPGVSTGRPRMLADS